MKPNILVLDDEQGICLFLSMSLEDDYTVLTANTPSQAYKILENNNTFARSGHRHADSRRGAIEPRAGRFHRGRREHHQLGGEYQIF